MQGHCFAFHTASFVYLSEHFNQTARDNFMKSLVLLNVDFSLSTVFNLSSFCFFLISHKALQWRLNIESMFFGSPFLLLQSENHSKFYSFVVLTRKEVFNWLTSIMRSNKLIWKRKSKLFLTIWPVLCASTYTESSFRLTFCKQTPLLFSVLPSGTYPRPQCVFFALVLIQNDIVLSEGRVWANKEWAVPLPDCWRQAFEFFPISLS